MQGCELHLDYMEYSSKIYDQLQAARASLLAAMQALGSPSSEAALLLGIRHGAYLLFVGLADAFAHDF